jgi:hypothetical protein
MSDAVELIGSSDTVVPIIDGVPSPEALAQMGADAEIREGIDEAVDYAAIAAQVAQRVREIAGGGEPIVALLVNPELIDGFKAAWFAIPEEVIPSQFKMSLPIELDDRVDVQIFTQSQLEQTVLVAHFGPTEQGGNGLIARLQQYLHSINSPVRLTSDVLRMLYFLELKEKVAPQILRANTPLNSGLQIR